MYLVSLFDFIIPTMKLRHANYSTTKQTKFPLAGRVTCHVPREGAVLDLIALSKPDTAIFSEL